MRRGLIQSEESVTFSGLLSAACLTLQYSTVPHPPSPPPPLRSTFPSMYSAWKSVPPSRRGLGVTKSSHHVRLLTLWQGWDEVY
jgi:hypothetical protein